MRKFILCVCILLTSTMLLSGCDKTVKKVAGHNITESELQKQSKVMKKANPVLSDKEAKDRALTYLALKYILPAEAKKEGIAVSDKDIRDDAKLDLVYNRLYDKYTKDVTVPEDEVKDYYHKNVKNFTVFPLYEITVNNGAQAADIYNKLASGTDFNSLVGQSADEKTKSQGGYVCDYSEGNPPSNIAWNLHPNQLYNFKFKNEEKYIVVKTGAERIIPFDEAKDNIAAILLPREKEKAFDKKISEWKKQYTTK